MNMSVFALNPLTGMAALRDRAQDWILEKNLGWPDQPQVNKIDTHHHMVPNFYAKAVEDNGGDPSGWPTPHWSPTGSKLIMERMGIQTAILSVTAPGACIVDDQQQQQSLARNLNDFAANIRNEDLNSFGFFASLPDIRNTTAAVEDISYALDQLHADGVTLFTRYGPGNAYLGHPDLEPVWEELNRRRAVVFVHPTQPVDTNLVNPKLLQPMIDYPHETTRTAMDMIMSRTLQKFPNVKVILSHAGGNLPYVITRLSTPLRKTPDVAARWKTGTQYDDVVESFRKFYYDVALSSAPQVLRTLFDTVPHDHILFGSDFPYAPAPAYPAFLEDLENSELPREYRQGINYRNAQMLFPRLDKKVVHL